MNEYAAFGLADSRYLWVFFHEAAKTASSSGDFPQVNTGCNVNAEANNRGREKLAVIKAREIIAHGDCAKLQRGSSEAHGSLSLSDYCLSVSSKKRMLVVSKTAAAKW